MAEDPRFCSGVGVGSGVLLERLELLYFSELSADVHARRSRLQHDQQRSDQLRSVLGQPHLSSSLRNARRLAAGSRQSVDDCRSKSLLLCRQHFSWLFSDRRRLHPV